MKGRKQFSSGPKHFKPKAPTAGSARQAAAKSFLVESWSADGRGVARDASGVTFITDSLPGEEVDARTTVKKNRYSEATLVRVTKASADRVNPACPHYADCGGCSTQHIGHPQQVFLKQSAALEQLARLGGVQPDEVLPPVVSVPWGYRHRCRFSVWYHTEKGRTSVRLGFRAKQSKAITDIHQCDVLEPSLSKLIAPLRDWLHRYCRNNKAVSHLELVTAENRVVVILRTMQPLDNNALAALQVLSDENGADCWLKPEKHALLLNLQGEEVDPRYSYALTNHGLEIGFHPLDFTQVNRSVNAKMVDLAIRLLAPQASDRVLDLFCGVGNFSLPLAKLAKQVIAVEADESMVVRGRQNALANGLDNITFVAEDLAHDSRQASWHKDGIDLALLDPPRAGAAEAIEQLLNLAPRALVYVSCNPATFARDASVLVRAGYRMTHFGVLDMFPQTVHIEAIAKFSR